MCPNQTTEHFPQTIQHVKKVKMSATQSCPTLCDPVDCSPLGSSVHGILQARILEWGAIPFSRGCLRHCRQFLYHLSHQGSRMLFILCVKLNLCGFHILVILRPWGPERVKDLSEVTQQNNLHTFLILVFCSREGGILLL